MFKYTPGPWSVMRNYNVVKGNRGIANCGGYTTNAANWEQVEEENKANTRLIARAPALDAALRMVKSRIGIGGVVYFTGTELAQIEAALKDGE